MWLFVCPGAGTVLNCLVFLEFQNSAEDSVVGGAEAGVAVATGAEGGSTEGPAGSCEIM